MCYIQVDAEEDEEEEEDAMDKRQKLQQKWRVVCIMSAADAELQGVARKERASWVQLWPIEISHHARVIMANLSFGRVACQGRGLLQ